MALRHWLHLSLTTGIGPILARRVIDAAGTAEAACAAPAALLQTIDGIGSAKSSRIAMALKEAKSEVDDELDRTQAVGARLICPDDEEYPTLLKTIPDPPLVLYARGHLEPRDLNAVAIVGSRKCSYYGREQAERFGALLGGAGISVLSGGARGIDSAAHRGAMSHDIGRTVAVLGCGINIVYPPENGSLLEQIAQRGAVLSEYPIDTPPAAENFPKRNRIVSGMSRGVLVIEADVRSGALITARQAGDDHGRPVFALPGRVDNPVSAGPHLLIRDGATLVTSLDDILEGLGPLPQLAHDELPLFATEPAEPAAPIASPATDVQRQILEALVLEPAGVDRIVDVTGLDVPIVLRELTVMSLRGLVRRVEGNTYARVR